MGGCGVCGEVGVEVFGDGCGGVGCDCDRIGCGKLCWGVCDGLGGWVWKKWVWGDDMDKQMVTTTGVK